MLSGMIGPEAVARRIMEKVAVATLAEDRKAALLELKEKALEEPVAVGKVAIEELCRLLPSLREDGDMARAAIETILACLSPEVGPAVGADVAAEAAATNSALMTQEATATVLELLEERSWSTRLCILKIFGAIQAVKPAKLQAAILQSPQGLARLMDVLAEENEIVRNEAEIRKKSRRALYYSRKSVNYDFSEFLPRYSSSLSTSRTATRS